MLEAKSAAYHKAYERLSRADCEILGGKGWVLNKLVLLRICSEIDQNGLIGLKGICARQFRTRTRYFSDVFISDHRKRIAASKQCGLWALSCKQSILVHTCVTCQ